MVAIPKNDQQETIDRIYEGICKSRSREVNLSRIGASGIGKDCLRAVYYDWRGTSVEKLEGRTLRIFDTGHQQEDRVIQDLINAGFSVFTKDEDGKQFEFIAGEGHFVCKIDGVVKGIPKAEKTAHVIEIKSSNKDNFDDLKRMKLKVAKPQHYTQLQMGMHLAKLDRGLYIVICKDNEEYYIERVELDKEHIAATLKRINELITNPTPPIRMGHSPESWICKYCPHKAVCWENAQPIINCRTCRHSVIMKEGNWGCTKLKETLTKEEQIKACNLWENHYI